MPTERHAEQFLGPQSSINTSAVGSIMLQLMDLYELHYRTLQLMLIAAGPSL